jgi:hypothetical protein
VASVDKRDVELAIAIIDAKLGHIRDDVTEIKDIMRGDYVRREEFKPVKDVIFGLVGVILIAVAGAMVTLVLKR